MPRLDQRRRLQVRERLADDGAADAELGHQRRLGGELAAGRQTAVADAVGNASTSRARGCAGGGVGGGRGRSCRRKPPDRTVVRHHDDVHARALVPMARDTPPTNIAAMATPSPLAVPSSAPPSAPPFERLLLTGAAGGLGRVLRPRLKRLCRVLRVCDIAAMAPRRPARKSSSRRCRTAPAVDALVDGVDGDRPPRRRLGRRPVRADPAGQHRRRLQPLRSGAPARRAPHRLRELEPRHRLLSAGRGARRSMPVRPDGYYGVSKAFGENLVALLLRPLRHRDRVPAHRLVVSRAEGPPHARHLAELRRPRAPRRRQPHGAGRRPQHRLRHVRQHDDVVGQHLGRGTSAIARRTAPSLSAPPSRRASPTLDRSDPGACAKAAASSPRALTN